MSDTRKEIEALLKQHFEPQLLKIEDESWKHAGHAGNSGGGHYHIHIRSHHFNGKSRVACHRSVMTVLRPLFSDRVHAASLLTEPSV